MRAYSVCTGGNYGKWVHVFLKPCLQKGKVGVVEGREGVASVSSCRMQLSKRESGGFSHTNRGPGFEALSKGSLFLKERICSWKCKI